MLYSATIAWGLREYADQPVAETPKRVGLRHAVNKARRIYPLIKRRAEI